MKLKDLMDKYGEYTVPNELIEKLEPPNPKTVWSLKDGDSYAFLEDDGCIITSEANLSVGLTKKRINNGNAFLTINEAENERERRKVETLLLKYGGRRWFKRDSANYFLEYDCESITLLDYTNSNRFAWQGLIYFDTRAQIENAIEQIGAERIVKAIFEVR